MKMPMTRCACLVLLFCNIGLFCSGCVSRVSKATYPDSWSRAEAVPAAQCPRLAGRYTNAGEAAAGTNVGSFCGGRDHYRGTWCGETALSQNIAESASGEWIELRQPDEDTLVVVSSDPTVAVQELHQKKGDFSCSSKGLERQMHVSSVSRGENSKSSIGQDTFNAVVGAGVALMYGGGGVRTLTRRFSLAADGSLVMAVSQSEGGAMLLIPYHFHDETFVRWTSAPAGDVAPTSSVDAAATPPADLPSAHVGIFEATNGKMWSKVKVTNLDGSPVNTEAGVPGVPIAMEPGRHWVEIRLLTHPWVKPKLTSVGWVPIRDVQTVYAFELDAVAGHRYRVPKQPSSCLAPGDVDAALAAANVYHGRLSIADKAPGAAERSFEVETLCASGKTSVCVPAEPFTGTLGEGLSCVQPEGWSRGYFGKDAGAIRAQLPSGRPGA